MSVISIASSSETQESIFNHDNQLEFQTGECLRIGEVLRSA